MATVQIGTGANRVKVAQAISRVTQDKPDWLNLESVLATANSAISGPCAKVTIPSMSTLQVLPSANMFISKFFGSNFYNIGKFIVRPSKGSNSAKIVTDVTINDFYISALSAAEDVDPDLTGIVGYLDPTDSSYHEENFTVGAFTGAMTDYVGPHITYRNNSDNPIELYFGTAKYEVDNEFVDWPTNTFITFKLVPNAFLP